MKIVESSTITKGSVWFIKPKVSGVKERFAKAKFESAWWTTAAPSLSRGDIINGYKASS